MNPLWLFPHWWKITPKNHIRQHTKKFINFCYKRESDQKYKHSTINSSEVSHIFPTKKALTNNLSLHTFTTKTWPKCASAHEKQFIEGLASTDENFPMKLWCQILCNTDNTLKKLRPSCINPTLSAYNKLCGTFNYNQIPMSPLGCKVIVHKNSSNTKPSLIIE